MSRYVRIENEDGTYTEEKVYTAEDMVDFARWVKEGIYKNKVGIRFNGEFVKYIEGIPVALSNEQVIKLWRNRND